MKEVELKVPFDPVAAARRLSALPGMSFLYSGLQVYGLGRYTILAACPVQTLALKGGDCFGELERVIETFSTGEQGRLPFYGGAIGCLSYDAGRQLEPNKLEQLDENAPLARFAIYNGGLVFDHQERRTWWVTSKDSFDDDLERIRDVAFGDNEVKREPFHLLSTLRSNFEREEYLSIVSKIRERILEGDVYQVNLSQRFEAECSGASFDLFLKLAARSPAPYSAYLDFGYEQIVSSSPERFLKVEGSSATTRPIKGTRPVGETDEETIANLRDLESSEKDRSELLMIVDLERNDLGRVCRPGSVRVDELFRMERYATVIHQTADVSGVLEDGVSAVCCVKNMFPGGSITGAPKIRSMQIIDELERGPRGVYTGAIGYFDGSGNADLNIAIRTMVVAGGKLSFQVGGGIVWDSVPESEYEETLLKARAMLEALEAE